MKKIINTIIILSLIFSIENINFSNADFIEDTLNIKSGKHEFNLDKYNIYNPRLKNKSMQATYYKLDRLNKKIKKVLIKNYKNNKISYYQMNGITKNYSNFIYYTNSYFSSLKKKEIYGNSKEIENNIQTQFSYMVSYYKKFKYIVKEKTRG